MKKMNFNKKLATVLSVVALGAAGLGVATVDASATTEPFTMDQVSVSMWEGASVRIPDETYTLGGLRYIMEMSIDDYETLMANVGEDKTYSSVEFGVFVAPEYYDEAKTIADVTNLTNAYGWLTEEEKEAGTLYKDSEAGKKGLVQIINTQSVGLTDATNDEKEEVKVFYGSVVNMLEDNMLEEYIGVGYIRYTDANGTYYKFATANDNVRSMTYVAQRAIDDNKDTNGTLNTTYVAPFTATETNYTVDYYFRNETGDYVKNETIKKSDTDVLTIGANFTPESVAIDGYTAVTSKTIGGTVYANGKSSFGLYYRAETNLFDFEKDEAVTTGFYGNVAGEEKLSVVSAPGRENDTALCMEDTGTNINAYIQVPDSIKLASLGAIDNYDMINFDIYVEATSNVSFFPYTSANDKSGLKPILSANQWKTCSVYLTDIKNNGNANYLRFWNGKKGYKVYISNITLSKWDNTVFDGETSRITMTSSKGTFSVVDDPTDSGKGKVYSYVAGSDTYDTGVKINGLTNLVKTAIALGYKQLELDVYITQTPWYIELLTNSSHTGSSVKPAQTGVWTPISIDLSTMNLTDGTDKAKIHFKDKSLDNRVYFDNIRFTK